MKILSLFTILVFFFVAALLVQSAAIDYDHSTAYTKHDVFSATHTTRWVRDPSTATIPNDATLEGIQLALPLRNEHLLDEPHRLGTPHTTEELQRLAELHDQTMNGEATCAPTDFFKGPADPTDEIALRLSLWRRILSPSCETVRKAIASLERLGLSSKCTRKSYDTYSCDALTQEHVERAFGVELERAIDLISKQTRLSAKKSPSTVPEGFSHIINLEVGPPGSQLRKHIKVQRRETEDEFNQFKFKSQKQKTLLNKKRNQHQQAGKDVNEAFYEDNIAGGREAHIEQVGSSSWGNSAPSGYEPRGDEGNAPHVVDYKFNIDYSLPQNRKATTYLTKISTDIYCPDGTIPGQNFYNEVLSCGSGSSSSSSSNGGGGTSKTTVYPKTQTIQVVDAQHGSSTTYCNYVFDNTTLYFACNADFTIVPNGGYLCSFKNHTLSTIKNLPRCEIPLWKPVAFRVFTTYSDGSTSGSTYGRVFFHGAYSRYSNIAANPRSNDPLTGQHTAWDNRYLLATPTAPSVYFPSEVRQMYGVPSNAPTRVHPKMAMGIFEAGGSQPGSGYNTSDLPVFMQYTQNTRFNMNQVHYVGEKPDTAAMGESSLDIMWMMSIAPEIPTIFWTIKSSSQTSAAATFQEFTGNLVSETTPNMNGLRPNVWSISYGACDTLKFGDSYSGAMQRTSTNIAILSNAGVILTFSSGDAGSSCVKTTSYLQPEFPASCPYVVSAGATSRRYSVTDGTLKHEGTSSVYGDLITSAGGRSAVFAPASHQAKILQGKLAGMNPGGGSTINPNGRTVPDIAALGSNIFIVLNGNYITVSGTSASAPIFAALLALWNNERMLYGNATSVSSTPATIRNANAFVWHAGSQGASAGFRDVPVGLDNCMNQQSDYSSSSMNLFPNTPCWRTTNTYDLMTGWGEVVNWTLLNQTAFTWVGPLITIPSGNNNDELLKIIEYVVPAVVVFGLLIALAWWCYSRKKRAQAQLGINEQHHQQTQVQYTGFSQAASV